ncbi:hypothetical protein CFI11_02330 [Thalassococcus sp. S3]|nr:hypothetical protein CFI11_02330 [Thalassococcus sp. S3]
MVERKQAEVFFRDLSRRIEEEKLHAREQIDKDLATLFDGVFSDRDVAVSAYADWFYAWGQTYKLVASALTVSMREVGGSALSSLWNMEMRIDANRALSVAERNIQDNLMEAYTRIILQPQHRDPAIETGVHVIVAASYDRFLAEMDSFDLELVEFLYAQDPHAQSIKADEIIALDLAWDAAQFDGPRNRSGQVVSSAAVSATILLSSALFSAEISAVLLPVVTTIGGELLATVGFAAGGSVLGSEVPVIGNIVGLLAGLSADYVINAFRENMTREEFEAETHHGLETTIARWKGKIAPELYQVNDRWYSDVRRILLPPHIKNFVQK